MSLSQPTQGIVCAIWTPLQSDGNVDYALLDRHLEWLGTTGLNGLMVLGSTGRFPFLSPALRESFIQHLLPRCGNSLPAVVNVSDLEQDVVARLGCVARDAGAQGVAVMPRWFYEQAQPDLEEWYVAAGRAAQLPLWIYTFPERTGNVIHLRTVQAITQRAKVGGFKNSGANYEFIRELAPVARERQFALFAGADARIPESLELGAVGCIGGMANALPEAMVKVFAASRAGNTASAVAELELLRGISERMHLVPFPYNIAAVMEARGIPVGTLPPTMSRVTRAHYEQLKKETQTQLEQTGIKSPW